MGMYKKVNNTTLQKLAGYTVIADGSCAEIRKGTWSISIPASASLYQTTVTFTDPMPDTDYAVILEMSDYTYGGTVNVQLMVFDKTVTGFKIKTHITGTTAGAISGVFTAIKLIPMEGYTELKNKVDNPDSTPTENSTNLCTSGGIYEAIKNASSVFVGTASEWAALTTAEKENYDIAVITDTHFVLSVDKTDGSTTEQANLNKIFRGTQAEWDALTPTQQNYYDQAEIEEDTYITNQNVIVASNKTVAVADWSADATYTGFGYKAEISIPGLTADYSPDVRFGFTEANAGIYAPVADSDTGKVIIYASEVPAAAITIPVIICTLMSV